MRTKQEIADEAEALASEVGPLNRIHTLACLIHDLAHSDEPGQADLIATLRSDVGRLTAERDELARHLRNLKAMPVRAAHPVKCTACRDTGVLTGNNDWPCSCAAGDHALFNTPQGLVIGARIKGDALISFDISRADTDGRLADLATKRAPADSILK